VARRRKRGTGGISQLPSGAWRAQLALPGPGRERKSFTSRNKGDVEFWLREATRAIRAGEDPDTIRTVLADYLDDWLRETAYHVKPATLRGYRIHVERWIVPAIGRLPLTDLTRRSVQLVRDRVIAAGRSPRTAAAVLLTLRTALARAVDDGILPRNVADGVKPPRHRPKPVAATSAVDARAIMAAFDGEPPDEPAHPLSSLVRVAIGTGLRLGELLGLRWADVTGSVIRVAGSVRPVPREDGTGYVVTWSPEAKTRRSIRSLEVAPFVAAALDAERRRQAEAGVISPYVFVTLGRRERAGEAVLYDPRSVTRAFQDQLERKGLPRMRFHDLRHAYATLSLAAGVPLRVVQEALGHTSIATTAAVYAHVLPQLQRDAAQRLDELLSEG
jgi:integrase